MCCCTPVLGMILMCCCTPVLGMVLICCCTPLLGMVLIIVFLYPNAGCNGNMTEVRIFLSCKKIEGQVQCNFTSTETTIRTIGDGEPGAATSVQFSSIQFKMVSMHSKKSITYALLLVCQKFSQRRFSNGSNTRLIKDGPLSSFRARS